jgi:hypothetical protein
MLTWLSGFLVRAGGRPSVLIEVSDSAAVLEAVGPCLATPMVIWNGTNPLPVEPVGTLVVPNVDGLDHEQQHQLMRWLDVTSGTAQVISTTAQPLFPLVKRGIFLEALYYRLNTIRVDLHHPNSQV